MRRPVVVSQGGKINRKSTVVVNQTPNLIHTVSPVDLARRLEIDDPQT